MATSLGTNSRVEPNLALFISCDLTYLTKTKIKDGNTCIYVFSFLLSPFFVSGEISPTPGIERNIR